MFQREVEIYHSMIHGPKRHRSRYMSEELIQTNTCRVITLNQEIGEHPVLRKYKFRLQAYSYVTQHNDETLNRSIFVVVLVS
jgi:hypothetical protein